MKHFSSTALLLALNLFALPICFAVQKTDSLDIVYAPSADPAAHFVIDAGNGPPTSPTIPAGSHFTFVAKIYPGGTFNVSGPFANGNSLISPDKILGTWICHGVFSQDTTAFVPGGGNIDIGTANQDFVFTSNPLIPSKVETLLGLYTVRSVDPTLAGTGQVARYEKGLISGGTGVNSGFSTQAESLTYVDANGNLLIRFKFADKINLP